MNRLAFKFVVFSGIPSYSISSGVMKHTLLARVLSLRRNYSTSGKSVLNILFFGSDEFSVHSLEALTRMRNEKPNVINTLQVVTKPPKQCGRYLAETKEVPIASFCPRLGLPPALRCDTVEDMKGPIMDAVKRQEINMLIAVSFGKLIPKQLIDEVPYTLNIHPSLLPRYKGSSPIQYTLMNHDQETGVSIQTLHPSRFDHGNIIAQSAPRNVKELLKLGAVSNFESNVPPKVAILMDQLGIIGANLLTTVLHKELYARQPSFIPTLPESYAPKIKTEMKKINWAEEDSIQVLDKIDALGTVYAYKEAKPKRGDATQKRVIFYNMLPYYGNHSLEATGSFLYDEDQKCLVIRFRNGINLQTREIQFEGFKKESCEQFMKSLKKRCGPEYCSKLVFT